ncbi:MAG: hypothetical protein ACREXN_01345 [Polaromonas sp.]
MKSKTRRFLAIVGIGLGLMMPPNMASADSASSTQLSAEWWQWVLSIPVSDNPLLDDTGAKCVVGQRGATWFLAGNFSGGTTTRTCAVPEGTVLFFPVINSVNIDTPNVCGQTHASFSVKELRAFSAAFIDGATNLSVEIDNKPIKELLRVQSQVFEVALPEENVFDAPCAGLGNVPAGIYSPAVDDGFYVRLEPLRGRHHTLHIHAENPSAGYTLDVTYNLTVVPVVLK